MAKRLKPKPQAEDECVIPPQVSPEVLNKYKIKKDDPEEVSIMQYMEGEASDENVVYLEKIKSEQIYDNRYDIWDVHTDKSRWWVITPSTNLYSQELFPSPDYTLSFHIGLITRIMAGHEAPANREQRERLMDPWRRWEQAAEARDEADEAEGFQAVGMRCRECLLSFVKSTSSDAMVPDGMERPKAADFVGWSELIANAVAKGKSVEHIRSYLKAISKSTWELVNWLTHATNAVKYDSDLAVAATENVLSTFGLTVFRYERGIPDRCPRCSSYKITSVFVPDQKLDPPYMNVCKSCGWTNLPKDFEPAEA